MRWSACTEPSPWMQHLAPALHRERMQMINVGADKGYDKGYTILGFLEQFQARWTVPWPHW